MRFERFIAKRFLSKRRGSFAAPLVKIAVASIALGVLVMIMSVSILRGFQKTISEKVVGFGSHIIVRNLASGNSIYQDEPFDTTCAEVAKIRQIIGVRKVQFFAEKGGMVKTANQIHGILFKGISHDYDTSFFSSNMVEGVLPSFTDSTASNEVIISHTIARKLGLGVGDKLRTYFWSGDNYRARAFKISGIYNTDLNEFDEHYIVGDLRQVVRLNEWEPQMAGGCEILVKDFNKLSSITNDVHEVIGYDLEAVSIIDKNQTLFAWLGLLNSNIVLIIVIMALVCIVSIISALLIMIFEKTSMIGILKTLGSQNWSIQQIFLIKSAQIVGLGIVIGSAIALVLGLIQQHFHILHLDPESYSVGYVPIDLNPTIFIVIAAGTIISCLFALLLPTAYISTIKPAKTIRFE